MSRQGGKGSFPNRGQQAFDEDDEDDNYPPRASAAELAGVAEPQDPLWMIYKINPSLPYRIKVQKLLLGWDMVADDIASILSEDLTRVKDTVREIESGWESLGEGLDDTAKKRERGKMVAELQELKRQVEELNEGNGDYKHLALKGQLMEKIAKLKGIETDKKELPKEAQAEDPLDQAINNMSLERSKDLYERLKGGATRPDQSDSVEAE